MARTIIIQVYGGYHNAFIKTIQIDKLAIKDGKIDWTYLSDNAILKLKRHMCGVRNCTCSRDDWKWKIKE